MTSDTVLLVDESDGPLGVMEKREAHVRGALHRALSVVLVRRRDGRMLLQRRALTKYHSPGRWANACCTHPGHNELPIAAARRRLAEEMGIRCELHFAFHFRYFADVGSGLVEHEFDHVFIGVTDEDPMPNPHEVAEWAWVDLSSLQEAVAKDPERFAAWFLILLKEMEGRPGLHHAVASAGEEN